MSVSRDGDETAWAASNSSQGWMVTGGTTGGDTNPTDSTEVFSNGSWITKDTWTLPEKIHRHCQVQAAGTVYVIGKTSIKLFHTQNKLD